MKSAIVSLCFLPHCVVCFRPCAVTYFWGAIVFAASPQGLLGMIVDQFSSKVPRLFFTAVGTSRWSRFLHFYIVSTGNSQYFLFIASVTFGLVDLR